MIVGSGLLAEACTRAFLKRDDLCIFAAGVSNSSCTDVREFARERQRLVNAMQEMRHADAFVYFGTCSIFDPTAQMTPYVQHKLAMEQLVREHPRSLILRLPQVAGRTPNPHTLLNFLYARISRSETFNLWKKAKRNIIDVTDVVSIAEQFIADCSIRNHTLNVANLISYSMLEIVGAMELVIGKPAVYKVVELGSEYTIDTRVMLSRLGRANVNFGGDYLEMVIEKYYKNTKFLL